MVMLRLLDDPGESPAGDEDRDADGEWLRLRSHRSRHDDVDEQQPHAEQLPKPAEIKEEGLHIRSKFFSISRRVSLSITGRPCGQIVEYAVARSSSRMCVIFSYVSG